MALNFRPGSPREGDRGPRRRPDSFWHRHLRPPSALAVAVLAVLLAAVVSLVTTLVFASVDANRPLETSLTDQPTSTGVPGTAVTVPEPVTAPPSTLPSGALTNDALAEKLNASVWLVNTRNEAGEAVEATAFVAGSFGGQTLLVTSLAVVEAATRLPAPEITVRQDGRTLRATLWTWQEGRDLALLTIAANSPGLPLAPEVTPAVGDRLYTLSTGRPLAPGIVTGVTPAALEHNLLTDGVLQGAPLVNQRGEVLAMASTVYDPTGRASTTIYVGVPIRLACERLLRCGAATVERATTTTLR